MMVAEFRDLIVATYSDALPISCEPTRWTFTGIVGGPCGPSAVPRLQPSSSTNAPKASTNTRLGVTDLRRSLLDGYVSTRIVHENPGPGQLQRRFPLAATASSRATVLLEHIEFYPEAGGSRIRMLLQEDDDAPETLRSP